MNLTNTIGWTLVHFVWQGAAIAVLLAAARYGLRKSSAQARYTAAMAAMLLMLASVGTTFVYLDSGGAPTLAHSPNSGNSLAASSGVAAQRVVETSLTWRDRMPDYFPVLDYIWMAGVLALSIRSLGGFLVTQKWKHRNVRLAGEFWQQRLARLAKRLAVSRKVRLWESAVAHTPAVIGWIRPVVLLPASAISGLTPGQIKHCWPMSSRTSAVTITLSTCSKPPSKLCCSTIRPYGGLAAKCVRSGKIAVTIWQSRFAVTPWITRARSPNWRRSVLRRHAWPWRPTPDRCSSAFAGCWIPALIQLQAPRSMPIGSPELVSRCA